MKELARELWKAQVDEHVRGMARIFPWSSASITDQADLQRTTTNNEFANKAVAYRCE
jgi:hypothetical protein